MGLLSRASKSLAQKEWDALDKGIARRMGRRRQSDTIESMITAAARPLMDTRLAALSRFAEEAPASNRYLTGKAGHRVSLPALLGAPAGAGLAAGAAYGLGGDRFQDELRFDGEQLNWLMGARERTDDLYEQLEAMRRGRVYGPAQ